MALFGPNTTGLSLAQSILHYKVLKQHLIVIGYMYVFNYQYCTETIKRAFSWSRVRCKRVCPDGLKPEHVLAGAQCTTAPRTFKENTKSPF